jgi:hypothetical protein
MENAISVVSENTNGLEEWKLFDNWTFESIEAKVQDDSKKTYTIVYTFHFRADDPNRALGPDYEQDIINWFQLAKYNLDHTVTMIGNVKGSDTIKTIKILEIDL